MSLYSVLSTGGRHRLLASYAGPAQPSTDRFVHTEAVTTLTDPRHAGALADALTALSANLWRYAWWATPQESAPVLAALRQVSARVAAGPAEVPRAWDDLVPYDPEIGPEWDERGEHVAAMHAGVAALLRVAEELPGTVRATVAEELGRELAAVWAAATDDDTAWAALPDRARQGASITLLSDHALDPRPARAVAYLPVVPEHVVLALEHADAADGLTLRRTWRQLREVAAAGPVPRRCELEEVGCGAGFVVLDVEGATGLAPGWRLEASLTGPQRWGQDWVLAWQEHHLADGPGRGAELRLPADPAGDAALRLWRLFTASAELGGAALQPATTELAGLAVHHG